MISRCPLCASNSTLQPSVWSLDISPAPPVPVIISSSDMVYSSVKFQRVREFVCVALRADSCSWLRNNSCRREREETERERERDGGETFLQLWFRPQDAEPKPSTPKHTNTKSYKEYRSGSFFALGQIFWLIGSF